MKKCYMTDYPTPWVSSNKIQIINQMIWASPSPVGAALGGVDELVGQALRDGLDVPEGGLAGAGAQQPDGLETTGFFSVWDQI